MRLIKHIGDQYSGHKIALCKDLTSPSWYEFNDNTVYKLSNQLPNESLVFLLFYQKLNGSGNYINSLNNQSSNNTSTTSKITDAINLYKQYEKDNNEKEKNFYKLLEKKV